MAYCRADGDEAPQAHITRQVFDAQGRDVAHFDPRFSLDGQVPNLTSIHGLSAVERLTSRADAGWSVVLSGEAGQLLQRWDSRSSQQRSYDGLLRPIAITEQIHDESGRVVERFEYGKPDGGARNQCGQLIRHDDPATTRHMPDFDLHGLPLLETSHFLKSLDPVNWPEELAGRDDLLENGPGLDSQWTYDALGGVATQTDAKLNRRRFSVTCAGQISAVHLQPMGAAEVTLVSDIHYNAGGQVEQERAGNDVITRAMFRPEDARLERLSAGLPGQALLQDLQYDYDAVGNPVRIEDQSKTVTYFKNQQVDPVSTYTYDSLYRLIAATGREVFHAANDPHALVNFREEYDYDPGGNSLELRHLGVQPFTRRWAVDEFSNRSMVLNDGDPPPDFTQAFDGNGNQKQLLRGQTLSWDTRNQLSEVSPVTRDDGEDDTELYRYGGGGKRLRKVRRSLAAGRNLIAEVRYLPGLEIHLTANGEERHVVEVEAGRNSVRLEHWVTHPPTGIDNDYLVYSLNDHLRSSLLELDEQGALISEEGYRPYGDRAWWVAHQGAKASYKTRGYSGKQRDATGLIYYGFRYYAPWQQRWINPDPAGEIDGSNLYRFVRNSPVRFFDEDGRYTYEDILAKLLKGNRLDAGETAFFNDYIAATNAQYAEWLRRGGESNRGVMGEEAIHPARQAESESAPRPLSPQPSTSRESRELLERQNRDAGRQRKTAKDTQTSEKTAARLKNLKCNLCEKTFSSRSGRYKHSVQHTGRIPCDECDQVFTRWDLRAVHKRKDHSHGGELSCPFCEKSFAWELTLQGHINSHTGEKPFKCALCSAAFATASNLQRHSRIHSGDLPYPCPHCGEKFSRSDVLAIHLKRFHSQSK